MRRADRLFHIVQRLRTRRVTTAAQLARELRVTGRTVYRDIHDLVRAGIPIKGEAGVGYALPRRFDLPPLMFSREEIEALVLGARVAESWTDPALAAAARSALTKVEAVLPEPLRRRLADTALFAPDLYVRERTAAHLAPLRAAIVDSRKVRLVYTAASGARTERTTRPLGLFFWGSTWSAAAWCELRADFRNFRLDRIDTLEVLDERFHAEPGQTLDTFLEGLQALWRDARRERPETGSCSTSPRGD